jgi:hypothetical protein
VIIQRFRYACDVKAAAITETGNAPYGAQMGVDTKSYTRDAGRKERNKTVQVQTEPLKNPVDKDTGHCWRGTDAGAGLAQRLALSNTAFRWHWLALTLTLTLTLTQPPPHAH